MKAYITKYALTSGVFVMEGNSSLNGIFGRREGDWSDTGYYGKDVHLTKESALARCEEMRTSKLKSIKKQMQKIADMKFEITEEL